MPTLYEYGETCGLSVLDLALVGSSGVDVWRFDRQPTTDDIAHTTYWSLGRPYTHCVQRIGDVYEVYDLSTLKKFLGAGSFTIGLPILTHTDADAAVMFALMRS